MTSLEQDIVEQFPPAHINNSREIVRRKLKVFHDQPSEVHQNKVEILTGWTGDHLDSDWGTGPRGANE